jgi:hypothetical protein
MSRLIAGSPAAPPRWMRWLSSQAAFHRVDDRSTMVCAGPTHVTPFSCLARPGSPAGAGSGTCGVSVEVGR